MIDIFVGSGAPLTHTGWGNAIADLNVPETSLWSILSVETRGFGYLSDRRPKILFERHIFHARTGGRFSAAHPDLSNRNPGGYQGGTAEYARLKRAMALNRRAALESASWGLGQIMGFNAESLGYSGVETMIEDFRQNEDAQLVGCVAFITSRKPLLDAFRARNWARVAFFYNGKNFAEKGYDRKLRSAEAAYSASPEALPLVEVRAAQARLSYLGYRPGSVDGIFGNRTRTALRAFQINYNGNARRQGTMLPESGELDAATSEALQEELRMHDLAR